ncbi:hypothetical protein F4778DRAFT_265152 [Xylariomycetidae sp. FL2044]|nr:hypothetical protein F4778DRAFT_265152 [Xylariomycetidae sp. FL2044]
MLHVVGFLFTLLAVVAARGCRKAASVFQCRAQQLDQCSYDFCPSCSLPTQHHKNTLSCFYAIDRDVTKIRSNAPLIQVLWRTRRPCMHMSSTKVQRDAKPAGDDEGEEGRPFCHPYPCPIILTPRISIERPLRVCCCR